MTIKPLYTAHAHATGGRDGRATIAGSDLAITLATPPELGGNGAGNNPEQLFAAGYAACFIGALKFVAGQDKALPRVPADVAIDSAVSIGTRDEGGFGLAVTLTIHLPGVDPAAAQDLVDRAHATCPYSNATRGNIDVTLKIAA
ncbi:MAG TPA: organic hydroperoxide resistance protein [Novosphingobium capsulatum]|jgi:Ohr subfamily peroxiredoxin|nr:organic hydroperoxide resistance protein [Novosphingobium aromaticivorans]HIQ16500.1 organic hydroperoxide resistance protein [Novosphingobium capsulatum]